jgi:hypothetical protein
LQIVPAPNICDYTVAANDTSDLIAKLNAALSAGGAKSLCLAAGSTYTLTAVNNTSDGPNGLPTIPSGSSITLYGNGATITRDSGAPNFRLFRVASGGSLTLDHLTVSGGNPGSGYNGGGIRNLGTLTLNNATVSGNTAYNGGGLFVNATSPTTSSLTVQNNTTVSGNAADADLLRRYQYAFDLSGNRTQQIVSVTGTPTTTNYTYNAANQLTSDGVHSLTYDNNGNMTSDGTNSYTWDRSNRLLSMGGSSYAYDGEGHRIKLITDSPRMPLQLQRVQMRIL